MPAVSFEILRVVVIRRSLQTKAQVRQESALLIVPGLSFLVVLPLQPLIGCSGEAAHPYVPTVRHSGMLYL